MNHLANEKSLYLRQHAHNPVDWHPWGEAALRRAREEDKPLLVSIGYSACHWCHVMAHESFEDDYTARLMNKHFVCIKVDREERPDIDQIYMEAVQMMNGHGGWPLNVFCLPDGRPFAGGTYFPPEDTGQGIVPWPQLLMRVVDFFQRNREELADNAVAVTRNLTAANEPPDGEADGLRPDALVIAAKAICEDHDDQFGGFGDAPKFPPSMVLDFLLAIRGSRAVGEGEPEFARRLDQVLNGTLTTLARGGLFDQLGGGFFRYSVDRYWLIPHFEKMLYDNGLLLDAFVKGWLSYRDPLYRAIACETAQWLLRVMRRDGGVFASSLDADSEQGEGAYYLWTSQQVEQELGAEVAERFCQAYGVTDEGNFEGSNHLTMRISAFAAREALDGARARLLEARTRRTAPERDDKQLVAWNALAIRGLAEAGFYLDEPEWLDAARKAADWMWDHMREDGNRLYSVAYDGEHSSQNGNLDDYAFLAHALLVLAGKVECIEPGASAEYVRRAQALVEAVLVHFADAEGRGFYFTSNDHETLPARRKQWFDNALPSGNSALVHVLSLLYAITGNQRYQEALDTLRSAYVGIVEKAPRAAAHMLEASTHAAIGICVIKVKGVPAEPLRAALAERPWRPILILAADEESQPRGYQLCIGTQCMQASEDPAEIAQMI